MRNIRNFVSDQKGAVAASYAIGITGLIIVAGAAFDYSRIMGLDTELQTAADQAALAAVTQLDKKDGACARAGNAAVELLRNVTLLSNDNLGNSVTLNSDSTVAVADDACASFTGITFFADNSGTIALTDEDARFVTVETDMRVARFSFTPLGGLFGADARALATAGMGSAVCEVPPLMICSPNPGSFDANAYIGRGVEVTKKGNGPNSWAPGIFGFLDVGGGQLDDLVQILAFNSTDLPCTPVEGGGDPFTGTPQDLYRAFNTRFDVFDFPESSGTTLSACFTGNCSAASNAVKDLVKDNSTTGGNNSCKLHNQGWKLPPTNRRFWPLPATAITSPGSPTIAHNNPAQSTSSNLVLGYSRDLCHYNSYNSACPGDRFGNGAWARSDYWANNHPGEAQPSGYGSMTRFQTYMYELGIGPYSGTTPHLPHGANQRSAPLCAASYGAVADPLRRVLTVAVVDNCAALNGGSTAVSIETWVDMFLVEPVIDARPNVESSDVIYMEVIGPADLGSGNGGGLPSAPFRRDVAYLLE